MCQTRKSMWHSYGDLKKYQDQIQGFDFIFFLNNGTSLISLTLEVEARRSNLRHRPVGLGVQGLADAFLMMKMPFESGEAKQLNEE